MSEDGYSDSSDEPNMEIQIETLMRSTFDLRVSATDSVLDIKRRIHRVEGIPVAHQNLIFQNAELQDFKRLSDVGIKDGSTVKLVLSMRGGPISTRRISIACEHQIMLKELKELLDYTRDESGERITQGSRVSVVIYKDGEVVNLLRVLENDDGSGAPYNEKPISPPCRSSPNRQRAENRTALFEKLVEDNKMMSKVATLRKKMEDTLRKKGATRPCGADEIRGLNFELFGDCPSEQSKGDDLRVFEHAAAAASADGDAVEHEELALKDKHRSRQSMGSRARPPTVSSLYSKTKGSHSLAKHVYARLHKRMTTTTDEQASNEGASALSNRFRVARLVLSDDSDKEGSSERLDIEEDGASDLWSTRDKDAGRRLNGAAFKLDHPVSMMEFASVLKRRQAREASSDSSGNYEITEGDLYHVSSPKGGDQGIFDYYCRSRARSPSSDLDKRRRKLVETESKMADAASDKEDDLCQIYELDSATNYLNDCEVKRSLEKTLELPPVMKKRARCNFCNRKLNITNIYNCRCGKIFCSQHRYSEVHHCNYDYKTEGRRFLEQQNPLVTAEKINRF